MPTTNKVDRFRELSHVWFKVARDDLLWANYNVNFVEKLTKNKDKL